jgi:hypothetical protein
MPERLTVGMFGDTLEIKIRLVDQMLAGLGLAPFGVVGDGLGDALALDQILDDELAGLFLVAALDDGDWEPRRSA